MRDFSRESVVNFALRGWLASKRRFRGRLYAYLNLFAQGSSSKITFGVNPRFVNSKWISLNENSGFGDFCRLECYSCANEEQLKRRVKIDIGSNCSFGDYVHLGAIRGITIGSGVLCASKVLIIDHNHGPAGRHLVDYFKLEPVKRPLVSKGEINIGNNVWIGESVSILGGVSIGDGSIIAANTVVRVDVPSCSTYFGEK